MGGVSGDDVVTRASAGSTAMWSLPMSVVVQKCTVHQADARPSSPFVTLVQVSQYTWTHLSSGQLRAEDPLTDPCGPISGLHQLVIYLIYFN